MAAHPKPGFENDGGSVDIRELIAHLNTAADSLPDGLNSQVLLHVCNGHDEPGVLTKMLGIAIGEGDEGRIARRLVIEGHPHADDEDTVIRPATMGVDDELERLVAGDVPPRPGITVVMDEDGNGVQFPYGEGGVLLLPGSPEAVAAGCLCDPEKNNHGRGIEVPDSDRTAMVTNNDCQVHPRVRVDSKDIPPPDDE